MNPADLTFTPLDGTLQNAIVQDWSDPDSDKSVERGPIENPAYVRGAFGGHPDLHWDNVTCDTDFDGNGTKGIWALDRKPAPTGEMTGCNQRWMAGSIISNCGIVTVRDDVVLHDCETWGGASGSPFLREKNGIVSVVGVGHGYASPEVAVPMPGICTKDEDCGPVALKFFCDHGLCAQKSANDQTPTAPVCLANDHKSLNVGASASRFLHAPRFASNVAVARRPDGDDATAVFAVDSDLNKVVFRERAGDLHSSPFTFWKPTPTVGGNEATLTRIAACSDLAGHPMVFVVGKQKGNNASRLFRTRFDPALGDFLGWVPVALQNLDSSIDEDLVDVDAAYDDKGNCLLFALDRGEKTIAFTDMTSTSWAQQPAWQTINATSAPATGTSLTALRNHDGYLWVTTIDAGGKLWALAQQCAGSPNFWFTYPNIPDRQNVSKWRDVDAFWSNKGEGKLIALPESLDYKILVQFDLPSRTCNKWDVNGVPTQPFNDVPIQTTLWTPTVTTTTLRPTLTTLTAGRWLEDKPGDVSPVIFGTDDFGNVYFIANTVGTGGWRLRWQSFNHEWLFYP